MTDWLRSKLRTLGLIAGVFVGFGILVELLGYITWYLAPTNRDALEAAAELNRALTGLVRQQPELRTQAPAQLDVERASAPAAADDRLQPFCLCEIDCGCLQAC